MKCEWCKKDFPHRKGRFCGTCQKPEKPTREQLALTAASSAFAQLCEAMTYEKAEELAPGTDYAFEATHQDENPIHWPDATAFFLEGYHRALRDLKERIKEIREGGK